jgi:integrase
MGRKKQEIIWPHLNDAGGDMKGTWYIEYALRNPVTDKMERVRHYDKFKDFDTDRERRLYAKKIIKRITNEINSGKKGYCREIEYDDLLRSGGNRSTFGRKKKTFTGSAKFYLSDFIKYKTTEITEKSLETYRSKLRIFLEYLECEKMSDKPVLLISNQLVIDFMKSLVEKKSLARKSVEKYQQILYSFFKYLIVNRKIEMQNPVLNIPRMGLLKDEGAAAIPAYLRRKLTELIKREDPQLFMAINFIYYMAIRPGTELRLMKLKQINYDSHTVVVNNYMSKNGRTEVIDIPDRLYDLITEKWHLQNLNQEFYLLGKEGIPGTKHLGKNTMRIRFNAFRDRLKLPKSIKYYSRKHSGAQEPADNGTSIYELQRHLRHHDISTTEQYLKKRIGQRSSKIKHAFPEI